MSQYLSHTLLRYYWFRPKYAYLFRLSSLLLLSVMVQLLFVCLVC